jgi:hypothetical protein
MSEAALTRLLKAAYERGFREGWFAQAAKMPAHDPQGTLTRLDEIAQWVSTSAQRAAAEALSAGGAA